MKKKVIIILLIIMVIVMFGIVGYMIVNNEREAGIIKEDSNEKINNQTQTTASDYDYEKAKILIDKYTLNYKDGFFNIFESKLDDNIKTYLSIKNIDKSNNNYKCEELFENNSGIFTDGTYCNDTEEIYDYVIVDKKLKELFGQQNVALKGKVSNSFYSYQYSDKKDVYKRLSMDVGGASHFSYYYQIEESKEYQDKLEITVGYMPVDTNVQQDKIIYTYKNGDKSINLNVENSIDENIEEFTNKARIVYDQNNELMKKYKFTFKKDTNENYYLDSIN